MIAMSVDVEIKGFETFWRRNKLVKRVVFRIKGEKVLRDLEIDPNYEYSEEELKEVIKRHLTQSGQR